MAGYTYRTASAVGQVPVHMSLFTPRGTSAAGDLLLRDSLVTVSLATTRTSSMTK